MVPFGDSIIAGAINSPYDHQWTTGAGPQSSWVNYGLMLAGQRPTLGYNAGISGNTTAQMLARIQADVIDRAPSYALVDGGTNDLATAVPLATIKTNLAAIYDALTAAGITPIACTIPPRLLYRDNTNRLNAWIKTYAIRNGLPVFDIHTVVADPATGDYKAGYAGDGIHPNATAGKALALALRDALTFIPVGSCYLTGDKGDAANLIANGTMFDTNADGTPDSWTIYGAAGSQTIGTDANVQIGNVLTFVNTGAANRVLDTSPAITAGWAVGDRVAFAGRVQTSGLEASGGNIIARVTFTGSTGAASLAPLNGWKLDIDWSTFYIEGTIPAGTTALQPTFRLSNNGTMKLGRLTLVNLTALGL